MRRSPRSVLGLAAAVALTLGLAAVVATPADASHNPGVTGKRVTIASSADVQSYDEAADDSGTAYIGWITNESGGRIVHLCTLPVGANSCKGGVEDISTGGSSTANDLRVLSTPSGKVTMLWFQNGPDSGTIAEGGEIDVVTATKGMNPTAASVYGPAPSNGELLDAEYSPDLSRIWTVAYPPLTAHRLQVTPGSGKAFVTVQTPWIIGDAQLAFSGGAPVMTIDKYGAISTPARYASGTMAAKFGKFHTLKGTWTGHPGVLKNTPHGLRYIGVDNDAGYLPVIAKWNGHAFSKATKTADRNTCPAGSDGSRDSSGRLLTVKSECGHLAIADYADDTHAAIYRFNANSSKTIVTGLPQIASGTRGIATVVWTTETDGQTGDVVHAVRVALPDTTTQVHKKGTPGKITLIGPTSCLPPVLVHVKIGANPAKGWSVKSRTLMLGSKTVHNRRIDGASLKPGTQYTLKGKAKFTKGGKSKSLGASLAFTTCAKG